MTTARRYWRSPVYSDPIVRTTMSDGYPSHYRLRTTLDSSGEQKVNARAGDLQKKLVATG